MRFSASRCSRERGKIVVFRLSYGEGKLGTAHGILDAQNDMPESESRGNDALRAEIHESPSDNRISLTAIVPLCNKYATSYVSRRLRVTARKTNDICTVSDVCVASPYAGAYRRTKDRVARKWRNEIREENVKILRVLEVDRR